MSSQKQHVQLFETREYIRTKQRKIKDQIIKYIWNLFDAKEEKEERTRLEKFERKKNKSIIKG